MTDPTLHASAFPATPSPTRQATTPPRALTIAGSDSGGGAGIQADLKTFAALGCFGMTAITAITVQNTLGVSGVHAIPAEIVGAQIESVASDLGVDAAKTGMLGSPEIVHAVAQEVERCGLTQLVVDPVMIATSGATLSNQETARAMVRELFPLARLITPNLIEASWLLDREIRNEADMDSAAEALLALGCGAVLLKGGHLDQPILSDLLVCADGTREVIRHPRIATQNLHGTGCTLAAAITAHLARGDALTTAIHGGIDYVVRAIGAGAQWSLGRGNGPLDHRV
jgi:hydroxymethylpyrimidine/phosphomethylpyrimidine kinase